MEHLKFQSVFKRFGGRSILHDLSFSLQAHCAVIIKGANGVGKTTALKIATGHSLPSEGHVEQSVGISFLPSGGFPFYENLTCRQNCDFFFGLLPPFAHSTSKFRQMVHDFSLTAVLDSPVRTLSTGTRQKIGIAIACSLINPCFILDEPDQYLDSESITFLLQFLKDHLHEGGSLLMTTNQSMFQELGQKITLE